MKIQRSPEEKIKLIQKYVQSGLSQTEFCKKNNLALTSFNHWLLKKKTISKSIKQKLNFVPLSVDDEFQENPKIKTPVLEKITLKTLSGIALELPISVSTSWLSSLLKELV
jgi:transposase